MTTARLSWTDRASALRSPWGAAAAAAAVVVALAYGPLLAEFFANLWARKYYQHFPFVLAAFVWLIAQRAMAAAPRATDALPRFRQALGTALVGLAWLLLAAAYAANSPWLAYVSFVLLTGGAIAWATSRWQIDGAWAAWLLLWLILPLPLGRDEWLVTTLQRLSSRASSFVLDAVGVLHIMEGNALILPEKPLFVDEACSGIISVMAIFACAAIYGVWRRRSALHVLALIVAGIAWATVMNTFRISAIAAALTWWGLDWSSGTPHEVLSLAVFLLAFLALISTDVLLAGLLAPVAATWEVQRGDAPRFGSRLMLLWDRVFCDVEPLEDVAEDAPDVTPHAHGAGPAPRTWWPRQAVLSAAFVVLPAYHFFFRQAPARVDPGLATAAAQSTLARARSQAAAFLPERVGRLRRDKFTSVERDHDDLMGNYSLTHDFRDADGKAYTASCDFPYEGGWHELTVCYLGIGWGLDERRLEAEPVRGVVDPWQRMEADFSKPNGDRAFVTVCAFDEFGNPVELPRQSLLSDAWVAISAQRTTPKHQVAFQVQVFTTSSNPIEPEQRQAARELMAVARDKFWALMFDGEKSSSATDKATLEASRTGRGS